MSEHLSSALENVFITDSDIRHIKRKHGTNEEERGQVAVKPSDFGRIPTVLNEFDTCEHTDTDKLGNKKFLLTKNMGHTVYLVTIQRGKRKLEIKRCGRERSVPRASRCGSLGLTSETTPTIWSLYQSVAIA